VLHIGRSEQVRIEENGGSQFKRDAVLAYVRIRFDLVSLTDTSKPRQDAPRGDGLEVACHRAAAMILVPTKILRAELKQRECKDARAIAELGRRFDVSLEVCFGD
jgi:hypothetical protein